MEVLYTTCQGKEKSVWVSPGLGRRGESFNERKYLSLRLNPILVVLVDQLDLEKCG